jgi:hypothetical protein
VGDVGTGAEGDAARLGVGGMLAAAVDWMATAVGATLGDGDWPPGEQPPTATAKARGTSRPRVRTTMSRDTGDVAPRMNA